MALLAFFERRYQPPSTPDQQKRLRLSNHVNLQTYLNSTGLTEDVQDELKLNELGRITSSSSAELEREARINGQNVFEYVSTHDHSTVPVPARKRSAWLTRYSDRARAWLKEQKRMLDEDDRIADLYGRDDEEMDEEHRAARAADLARRRNRREAEIDRRCEERMLNGEVGIMMRPMRGAAVVDEEEGTSVEYSEETTPSTSREV